MMAVLASERTPQAYREHFRHHLSPSVAQMASFDEMERDLELVRRISENRLNQQLNISCVYRAFTGDADGLLQCGT